MNMPKKPDIDALKADDIMASLQWVKDMQSFLVSNNQKVGKLYTTIIAALEAARLYLASQEDKGGVGSSEIKTCISLAEDICERLSQDAPDHDQLYSHSLTILQTLESYVDKLPVSSAPASVSKEELSREAFAALASSGIMPKMVRRIIDHLAATYKNGVVIKESK